MIKQLIDIDGYWEVIVYYNIDYNFFNDIAFELKAIGSPVEKINDVYYKLKYENKAVTCSNIKEHISVVLCNYHKSRYIKSVKNFNKRIYFNRAWRKSYN